MQEEIVDETDEYVDVHKRYREFRGPEVSVCVICLTERNSVLKLFWFLLSLLFRIRVAAATAASSVARAPSSRRLNVNKGTVSFLSYLLSSLLDFL